MSQQSRRHDPYRWTWEIPLGIVLVILMVLVCGCILGAASPMCGPGLAGRSRHVLSCLGVCLPFCVVTPRLALMASTDLSSPSAVWRWAVVTELILLAISVLLLKLFWTVEGRGGCVAWRVGVRRRGCLASPVCGRSVRWSGRTCTE
jgi:hypothetical protein